MSEAACCTSSEQPDPCHLWPLTDVGVRQQHRPGTNSRCNLTSDAIPSDLNSCQGGASGGLPGHIELHSGTGGAYQAVGSLNHPPCHKAAGSWHHCHHITGLCHVVGPVCGIPHHGHLHQRPAQRQVSQLKTPKERRGGVRVAKRKSHMAYHAEDINHVCRRTIHPCNTSAHAVHQGRSALFLGDLQHAAVFNLSSSRPLAEFNMFSAGSTTWHARWLQERFLQQRPTSYAEAATGAGLPTVTVGPVEVMVGPNSDRPVSRSSDTVTCKCSTTSRRGYGVRATPVIARKHSAQLLPQQSPAT
jgi:hypothetical protein